MDSTILSVEELAEFLKVPRSWIYERTRTNRIPRYKMGKYVRFNLADILDWLDESRSCPSMD